MALWRVWVSMLLCKGSLQNCLGQRFRSKLSPEIHSGYSASMTIKSATNLGSGSNGVRGYVSGQVHTAVEYMSFKKFMILVLA